jgi:hypothetical protein
VLCSLLSDTQCVYTLASRCNELWVCLEIPMVRLLLCSCHSIRTSLNLLKKVPEWWSCTLADKRNPDHCSSQVPSARFSFRANLLPCHRIRDWPLHTIVCCTTVVETLNLTLPPLGYLTQPINTNVLHLLRSAIRTAHLSSLVCYSDASKYLFR